MVQKPNSTKTTFRLSFDFEKSWHRKSYLFTLQPPKILTIFLIILLKYYWTNFYFKMAPLSPASFCNNFFRQKYLIHGEFHESVIDCLRVWQILLRFGKTSSRHKYFTDANFYPVLKTDLMRGKINYCVIGFFPDKVRMSCIKFLFP